MNYYQHHIGDFIRDTARLNDAQTMAYLRLLWRYYESEEPLADDADMLAFTIGSDADTVRLILRCFFKLENGAWHQSRCDREIAAHNKAKLNHWARKLTKAQRAEIQARRNATKANATPKWLSAEDNESIARLYAHAACLTAKTGIAYEVDHIFPLRGKLVCGLHVPANLRVIRASENRAKSNIFEVSP